MQEILYLHRVYILTARYDDIFLPVNKVIKALLILLSHIAGIKPALVIHDFRGRLLIMVIADHDAGTLYGKLTDLALLHFIPLLIHYLALPAVSRHSYSADMVYILDSQMHAAGTYRLRESVVRIILMLREIIAPMTYQRPRHGLRPDMHKPPLFQLIIRYLQISSIKRVKYILRPGN